MNKMNFLKTLSSLLCIGFTCASLSHAMPPFDPATLPDAPDYSKDTSWLSKPETLTAPVDVFYVYPTVLFNDTDWVMDINRADMRGAAQKMVDTQAIVFAGQANIYAPMYRQMNLAGLNADRSIDPPLSKIIHSDVWDALQYYLQHENQGRPFFLAGHSQGSLILTNLMLEHWGDMGIEDQLVAAYLIGWSITEDNLAEHSAMRICESAEQTGCIVTYNSMAEGKQSVAPTLLAHAAAVNPLSWTTDGEFVSAEKNLGAVFFDSDNKETEYKNFASAQIKEGGLVVDPQDADLVTVKGGHFPEGVYHAFDYSIFFMNLQENIGARIQAYEKRSH